MNTENLARLIVEIIRENYEEITAAHESGDWKGLKDCVF